MSDAVDRAPALVSHLVAIGISAMAVDGVLSEILPDLKIGNAKGAISAKQARELIAMLLDEKPLQQGQRQALVFERMMQLDTCILLSQGKLPVISTAMSPINNQTVGYLYRPTILTDARLMIRRMDEMIATLPQPDWPSYQKNLPPLPKILKEKSMLHAAAAVLWPSLDRTIERQYRGFTDRRLVAMALAIRLYASEHEGKFPVKLEDLVPNYLPAIPMDPMSSNQPLKYVASTTQPIIYSVGVNGTDEGGSEKTKRPTQDASHWVTDDAVLHLTRQMHPATQP